MGKLTRRKWEPEDDRFLAFWYGEHGIPVWAMADDLGRTEASIRQRLAKLGIKSPAGRSALKEASDV